MCLHVALHKCCRGTEPSLFCNSTSTARSRKDRSKLIWDIIDWRQTSAFDRHSMSLLWLSKLTKSRGQAPKLVATSCTPPAQWLSKRTRLPVTTIDHYCSHYWTLLTLFHMGPGDAARPWWTTPWRHGMWSWSPSPVLSVLWPKLGNCRDAECIRNVRMSYDYTMKKGDIAQIYHRKKDHGRSFLWKLKIQFWNSHSMGHMEVQYPRFLWLL